MKKSKIVAIVDPSDSTEAQPTPTAIYARVSSQEMAKKSYNSCESQCDLMEMFVESQSDKVYAAYKDEGYTGRNMKRPALKRLLADVEAGLIKQVVVYRIDRLGRNLKQFLSMLQRFEEHGVTFKSTTEPIDTSTAMGKLVINMLASFAQFESDANSEKVTLKNKRRAERGLPTSRPPDGYVYKGGEWIIDPERAPIIKRIFELMLDLRSTARVRDTLNSEGVFKKSGKRWELSSLRTILTNPAYYGMIRHHGKLYPGKHEPIIKESTFNAIAGLEKPERRRGRQADRKREYPLHSILRCGHHGTAMTPYWVPTKNGRRVPYYRCNQTFKRGKGAYGKCPAREVNADKIEKLIFEELFKLAGDPELVKITLDLLNAEVKEQAAPLQEEIDRLRLRERDLDAQIENILDVIAIDGDKSERTRRRRDKLEAELAILRRNLEGKERAAREIAVASYDPAKVSALLKDFELLMLAANDKEKEQLCQTLLHRITYGGKDQDIELEIYDLKKIAPQVRNLGGIRRGGRDSNPRPPA